MDTPPEHLIERAACELRSRLQAAAGGEAPAPRAIGTPAPAPIDADTLARAGLSVTGAQRSRAQEEWRIIASTLLRRQPVIGAGARLANTLMVTSSRSGEGKSFSSLNLAATLARDGRRQVVLVDLDAKPTALSAQLGLAERAGLHDLAADPALPICGLIVPSPLAQFGFLPRGRTAALPEGQPPGVTPAMIAALRRLARQPGEWLLVFDTSPCLATSDAASLAPVVGQVAMVVEAERTQRSDIEAALALLEPCETITLVLNKSRAETQGHFGADYYYYGTESKPHG